MKASLMFALIFFAWSLQASSWENLVDKLIKARAEIETMSQELDSLQKEKQSNLDQLMMRKSDLETQVERENLRRLQLSEKLKRLEGRVQLSSKSDPKAQAKLQFWIKNIESSVKSSIPYEKEERLATLARLNTRVLKNHEPMEFILSDLWNFMESEFKLSQTNEYQILTIDFMGKKKKCEVARLGLISMFAVTADGVVRRALKNNDEWSWIEILSDVEKTSVLSLVKNLKNKNNVEIYQLPVDLGFNKSVSDKPSSIGLAPVDSSGINLKQSSKKVGVSL